MSVFNKYYKKYDYWYDRHKFAYLSELEALKKVVPHYGRGLEIGAGTGRFAAPLGIAVGIEPSANMSKLAQERGIFVCRGVGESLPFFAGSFDYVAVIITLCFVKDPLKLLLEAFRVLADTGKVIVAIVDKNSFLGEFYRNKKSLFYREARFFNVMESKLMMEEAGFRDFSSFQTLFDFPARISSIQEPLKGFGNGGFVVIKAEKTPQSV